MFGKYDVRESERVREGIWVEYYTYFDVPLSAIKYAKLKAKRSFGNTVRVSITRS